jgi:hypothetical protein
MNILDFEWYAKNCLKIQTKSNGIQPFVLRKVQLRFLQHLKDDFPDGIIRSISLKPRQAGWSTVISGINTHRGCTRHSYSSIVMADKFDRTNAVFSIYKRFVTHLPPRLRPMMSKFNESEILFDNPSVEERIKRPGLSSGFLAETAQDPDAGKSASRQGAHLSEYAFYPYAAQIDTSVQNSIPLARGTAIFKESTANGMAGDGESFYEQWTAAESGDYLYKPFFVAWYEIDDYQMTVQHPFILNSTEIDLLARCPEMTHENLQWRRMKIKETRVDADMGLTPEEYFKQDFPSYPEEAFLSTGRPVFDMDKLKRNADELRRTPPPQPRIDIKRPFLSMYAELLTVYSPPQKGMKYSIGADVAEGLSSGDASSAFVLDANMVQVAKFYGHLDPDHFGEVLVELGRIYNNAILVPEINSMGNTTLEAIKRSGYGRVYMREVKDEIDPKKITVKMGWRTTVQSKQVMLNSLIAAYRDNDVVILDIDTIREMIRVSRGENGMVDLNGKDRVVSLCLAIQGLGQTFEKAEVFDPSRKEKLFFENKDVSREKILKRKI